MNDKWHYRFLELARQIASWSKDPSRQIGAVATRNKQILSVGYNGFPRHIEDTHARLNDRETKYKFMVHAEQNLIYNAVHNGVSLENASLYVWGLPVCSECTKGIIQAGIKHVYWSCHESTIPSNWLESYELTKEFFSEANVTIERL